MQTVQRHVVFFFELASFRVLRRRVCKDAGVLLSVAVTILTAMCALALDCQLEKPPLKPRMEGDWWQVAENPDLGPLTSERQQVVDFGIWQAEDGTWQLWSCIRHTKEVGHSRLFFRWEGRQLTQSPWEPKGIAMRADPDYGEQPGGLQAPFVFRIDTLFHMFYGGWDAICLATSQNGKDFIRKRNEVGKSILFGPPDGYGNPRDPMVLRVADQWYCYFTAHTPREGAVFCRTSRDLVNWSDVFVVAKGGQAGSGSYSAECPFVVEVVPGEYYLFRTQRYGSSAQTSVYRSNNPLDFGIDNDEGHFVCTLPVAAPEIFRFGDSWYIAALMPNLSGIQIARPRWTADDSTP